MLAIMLLAIGCEYQSDLAGGDNYSVVRFAIYVAMLIANFAESNFACMTPLGFLFLAVAIGGRTAGAAACSISCQRSQPRCELA